MELGERLTEALSRGKSVALVCKFSDDGSAYVAPWDKNIRYTGDRQIHGSGVGIIAPSTNTVERLARNSYTITPIDVIVNKDGEVYWANKPKEQEIYSNLKEGTYRIEVRYDLLCAHADVLLLPPVMDYKSLVPVGAEYPQKLLDMAEEILRSCPYSTHTEDKVEAALEVAKAYLC